MTDGDALIQSGVDVTITSTTETFQTKARYHRHKTIKNLDGVKELLVQEHIHLNAADGKKVSSKIGVKNGYTLLYRESTYRFLNFYVNAMGNYVFDVEVV